MVIVSEFIIDSFDNVIIGGVGRYGWDFPLGRVRVCYKLVQIKEGNDCFDSVLTRGVKHN